MFAQQPEKKSKQSGFTLIELAIIMAIIAVLGAVGAVKFASMKDEAVKAAESSALANVRSALAIAVAKDTNSTVEAAELAKYLEGGETALTGGTALAANDDDAELTWTPKTGGTAYTVVVTTDKNKGIDSIVSVKTKA